MGECIFGCLFQYSICCRSRFVLYWLVTSACWRVEAFALGEISDGPGWCFDPTEIKYQVVLLEFSRIIFTWEFLIFYYAAALLKSTIMLCFWTLFPYYLNLEFLYAIVLLLLSNIMLPFGLSPCKIFTWNFSLPSHLEC